MGRVRVDDLDAVLIFQKEMRKKRSIKISMLMLVTFFWLKYVEKRKETSTTM